MGALLLVGRAEWRRRTAALVGLATLAAVVTAAILSLAAGGRRTASSLSRFEGVIHAADAYVQYGGDDVEGFEAGLRRLPAVERIGTCFGYSLVPKGVDPENGA